MHLKRILQGAAADGGCGPRLRRDPLPAGRRGQRRSAVRGGHQLHAQGQLARPAMHRVCQRLARLQALPRRTDLAT